MRPTNRRNNRPGQSRLPRARPLARRVRRLPPARVRVNSLTARQASSANQATTSRFRLCRFGPRRSKIENGWRQCVYTARPVHSKTSALVRCGDLASRSVKLDPDSIAVIRRLCRLYVGALGRPELALQYGKRVLAIDPGDTTTLGQLVDFYRKNDPAGAEGLLNDVLANPKLDAHAPARLLAEFELGKLYSGRLHQNDKAAEAFGKVLEALDDKSANRLSPADLSRVLQDDPAAAYLEFSKVFLLAKKFDLAVKALERGLVYDDSNSQIALLLADTLVTMNKGEQALALIDRHIERQTPFVEFYELLARVLKTLHREKEITPRLEAAARRDSKNIPLQYVLADRYRELGDVEKAEALYKELLTSQPTPQTYRALAASLLKRKKAADLLKVIGEAWVRPESQDMVKPQLVGAAIDDAIAEAMLDEGLKQCTAHVPTLSRPAFEVLSLIATNPGRASVNKKRRLEKLLRLERLMLEQNPTPVAYAEIADTLRRMGNFAEAATAIEQLIAKFPNAKTVRNLGLLADHHRRAGHIEAAKATLREAMALDPATATPSLFLSTSSARSVRPTTRSKSCEPRPRKSRTTRCYDVTLADLLYKSDRKDEAIKAFEDILKRHADNDEIVSHVRQTPLGHLRRPRRLRQGRGAARAAAQRNPDDPGPNNDLGYLYAEQGKNLEKAESMIRKALLEDPESFAYLDSLGWVLFKRGKVKEALEPLKKAAEQMKSETERRGASPDATILEHLGDVYFQLQQLDQANDAWRQAAAGRRRLSRPTSDWAKLARNSNRWKNWGPMPKPTAERTP